ncbi:cyclase family protein [Nocardia carnea]|uniref:cyclase family protein n=1 Tax=Nocardia carnea TaxID=37328 RepID=UPI002455BFDA|nr:cyclase family protein [Nocardia carnea]
MSVESGVRVGNWGRWGDDDERGALNLLTDDVVREARSAIKTGSVYALGLPIQRAGIPNMAAIRGVPQRLTLQNYDDAELLAAYGIPEGVGANEDMLVFASHTSTHMDALCHVFADNQIYNGHGHNGVKPFTGAARCGIEKAGAFATRGLMLDFPAVKGVEALEPGYTITVEDIEEAMEAHGVQVRPGDVVLTRTGWVETFLANGADNSEMTMPGVGGLLQAGIGIDAARYLADRDVVAVGADNTAVEVMPYAPEFMACHIELLVKRGIYLIEHMKLDELSRDRCYEFFFTVAPLPVTGATASPVNPIAIG